MADAVYDGEVPHSGARYGEPHVPHSGKHSATPFRVSLCNKMFNKDGTLTGNTCPHGNRCTFLHKYKERDCNRVVETNGCKHGDKCTYRHPGDPGYGEGTVKSAASATQKKATSAAPSLKQFEMPDDIRVCDVLNWLKLKVADDRQPVLSAVFDGKVDEIHRQIDDLIPHAKLVDAVRKTSK